MPKIAVLGAGGVRTPLIVEAMARRQARLRLDELTLMDIDGERLEIIGALLRPLEQAGPGFRIVRTLDPDEALDGADFVITTFRVGGIASRVVDERVPLRHGVLGQETTGPGGFAMAMRTIPVLLDYLARMRRHCPNAWLINFANPAGLLAEAALRVGDWPRTVGICDAPESMGRIAAALVGVPMQEIYLDYFGLNHLGWLRGVWHNQVNHLPRFIEKTQALGKAPGLPFAPTFLAALGMIPNEYLFYYYHAREAMANQQRAGHTRGEEIAGLNQQLFAELVALRRQDDFAGMQALYHTYLTRRGETYMMRETGNNHDLSGLELQLPEMPADGGYAGVALGVMEGLLGGTPRQMILNLRNDGAIWGMDAGDVVEVPVLVAKGIVRPLAVGRVPPACLGLMQEVKAYEQLTIAAAVEGSYHKAHQALALHPLVRDMGTAQAILDDYIHEHGALFPALR